MAYLYETHLHTLPVSACARAELRETLECYRQAGYAGVFLTNHFLDSNIDRSIRELPYHQRIDYYFDSCEEGRRIGEAPGFSVFPGIEMGYGGTDFLVYGIDREWCHAHEDMDRMPKSQLLELMREQGALLIQAHPFRESRSIDHIRLFPRHVHDNLGDRDTHLMPYAGTMNPDALMRGLRDIGYQGYFTFEVGNFFLPLGQRREFLREDKLRKPPLALRKKAEELLYEIGREILSAYGLYEC